MSPSNCPKCATEFAGRVSPGVTYGGSNTIFHAYNLAKRLVYCSEAKNHRWKDENGYWLEIGDCPHFEGNPDACGLPLVLKLDFRAG